MMQNLVCTAFLAAALGASTEATPQPSVSETTTTTPAPTSAHIVVELGSSKSKVHAVKYNKLTGKFGKVVNKETWYPYTEKNIKKINKAKAAQLEKIAKGDAFKQFIEVKTDEEFDRIEAEGVYIPQKFGKKYFQSTVGRKQKGLADACDPLKGADTTTCDKHLDAIRVALEAANKEFTFLSFRVLGTAGVRQSSNPVETLEKLENLVKNDHQIKTLAAENIEYRPLSKYEEAENEALSVKDLLETVGEKSDNLGVIGFGGASLQYAIEAEGSEKKQFLTDSFEGGADVAKKTMENNSKLDDCKTEYERKNTEDVTVIPQNTKEACMDAVKAVFPTMFDLAEDRKTKWENPQTTVYAIGGGITYAMQYDYIQGANGKYNSWDLSLTELENMQHRRCVPYFVEDVKDIKKQTDEAEIVADLMASDLQVRKWNDYYKDACFKFTYFLHVLESLGVTDGTRQIHIRMNVLKKTVGEPKPEKLSVDWVTAATKKKFTPEVSPLSSYDLKTITDEADREWKITKALWENQQSGEEAPETVI